MTLSNGRTPAHALAPIENPHIDTYAMPYERGHRADQARFERAEIAADRAHERPAHLPYFPESWEDDFTPQPWEHR